MEFLPFFLVLFVGILFSSIFRRFHIPWVVALLVAGMVVGPYGFSLFKLTPTITFMGQVGLVFLMFMAGLETKLSSFKEFGKSTAALALLNGTIPFAVGFGIGIFFGFDILAALLLGVVFISSSIAIIVPTLEAQGVLGSRLGSTILSATIIEDIASLVLLSVLFQTMTPSTSLPLPLFYFSLLVALVILRRLLPMVRLLFSPRDGTSSRDVFQRDVRVILVLLIGTVIIFELLGLHPIIAGFFAGLVLSDSIRSEVLVEKLRTLSYGLFIPIFFVVIGFETNVAVLFSAGGVLILTTAVVVGSVAAKFGSGWLGGRLSGFERRESLVIGAATLPQLSTTLAVVFSGIQLGLFGQELMTAMVVLSIVTTMMAPILVSYFMNSRRTRVGARTFKT
jgi:Kef-type K+ transport system membrane component KefB